ncbi:MAG: chromosome segregation protein SMC [Gemmatimonadota bacterium]
MRLTKLDMQGFKSFADSTTMVFDDGVTAIVGPNGCGKSNVSDAVRWVLGEQRARMLRGSRMEEVIFQGSSARRAVNVAEVSLHFSNEEGAFPVAFREVVITRRLSRSGESEYLMNGALCRLRDIHDMLRGTGLGAESGVVIEARMIDALLSDRPDERRELFEEAAGIGLYRDRRRSTERRLEETTLDLARLDDVLGEVQSQVRSLARQRRRAERYDELRTRRFAVDLTLASREMAAWREELQSLDAGLAGLRSAAPAASAAVAAAEGARDTAHSHRSRAEAARTACTRAVQQHQSEVQARHADLAVAVERRRNSNERMQRAGEERQQGLASGERLELERQAALAERENHAAEVKAAAAALAHAESQEEAARLSLSAHRDSLESAEAALREARENHHALGLDRDARLREVDEVRARIAQIASEHGSLVDTAGSLSRQLEDAEAVLRDATRAAGSAAGTLSAAQDAARRARDEDALARAELAQREDQRTSLAGRVNALEGLERERVGLAPAAARLLRERQDFGEGAILGPLSDFVSTSTPGAATIERFLGMTVHAVVVRDAGVSEAVRQWHVRISPGPLLLLPLDAVDGADGGGDLLGTVEVQPQLERWVRSLLGRVRIIGDGAAFVDARGAVWLPGSGAGPGPLRRRAELFALRAELLAGEDARDAASRRADDARARFVAAEESESTAREMAVSASTAQRSASDRHADAERELSRAARTLADAEALTSRLRAREAELLRRLGDLEADGASALIAVQERETAVVDARDATSAGERAVEAIREQRATTQVVLARAEARLQVARESAERVDREFSDAASRLGSLSRELSELEDSNRLLDQQIADWNAMLEERTAELEAAEARLATAEREVQAADETLIAAERALDSARREVQRAEADLHHSEVRFVELSGRRTAIRERLETEWRRPLEDLLTSYQPVEASDDELRVEAEQTRADIEKLGPVNPLAIEEHEEEVKRLDFLTGQRNDLSEARNKLHLAIREIDVTAREMFLQTFAEVRENFRQIFMTLFGGGECELRLENSELPLDCDIEIHASPRGKRTQRIHLLSSGERALVALSLLFGIFLTRPSPFCLLDEVDAPLDDANIGRFVRMLTQFKQRTQFIVITHNPRTTTEAADSVYGVTMQEPGVSSLVSVRMRGTHVDEPERGEAPEAAA